MEEEENMDFPEVFAHSAPMRFRGPARIALLNKYVAADPFEGDTEIEQWSVGDVKIWISNLEGGVSQYAHNFMANHIKGQDLLNLTNQDLRNSLGIKSVGHRQIIMQSIEELRKCVIVEINVDRFLVPPNGAVMRFEDVSVQERSINANGLNELKTILGHVTGTFLPNQITAIMGDTQKSLLLKVLSGYNITSKQHITGHIFVNGNPINGSLVNAGLASYINGCDNYGNFTRTTVADLVKFYVKLSGSDSIYHHPSAQNAGYIDLVNHVLRISDINYPQNTKICELKPIQYKRLMIAIDVILYDIKLIFLDKILDGLSNIECQEMMQMIYSFSRKLDITFILSVERIRYHILNAYFDQVIVVGGVDAQKIVDDCTKYYQNADLDIGDGDDEELKNNQDPDQVIRPQGSMNANDDEDNMNYLTSYNLERNRRNHTTLHNDLVDSATSIRFVGRPEDVVEYFRLKQVVFEQTENPIEVIFEHVVHNFELIEPELEEDYFRYRKKNTSLSPFTSHSGPRNSKLREIWIITQFVLMIGWREWSLLFSCLRIIGYCVVVGALFWDVSCDKYFLNERLLAIFVISCIPMACVWPLADFHRLHRDFWCNNILFPNRARQSSFIIALIILCSTHAAIIGLFSFIPWLMEDLGCNDTIAFIRIGFMQFACSLIYGFIALFGAEIFKINQFRLMSVLCTASVLFAGALVHAGHVKNRPGTAFITIDFLKYSLEFLLFTDVDYIQKDACSEYLASLEDRQYFDREPVDIMVILLWIIVLISVFSFTIKHEIRKSIAYSSQFMIGRLSYKRGADEFEIPSLPPTPPLGDEAIINNTAQSTQPMHGYSATTLTSLGQPTPIQSAVDATPNIPALPLNMTPVSHVSHGTGAFTRISTANTDTPTTPLHLTGIHVF